MPLRSALFLLLGKFNLCVPIYTELFISMWYNFHITILFVIIVLATATWFYGYHNRKSNDNLPSLASIAQMDEAEVSL